MLADALRADGEGTCLGGRPPLELCFYLPGKLWTAVFLQDDIVALGVDVFGVQQKTVHIKETGANFGESGASISALRVHGAGWVKTYSIVFAIMVPDGAIDALNMNWEQGESFQRECNNSQADEASNGDESPKEEL